jgi:hypothetical protein
MTNFSSCYTNLDDKDQALSSRAVATRRVEIVIDNIIGLPKGAFLLDC